MFRRLTEREKELSKIVRPYEYYKGGRMHLRDDAPIEAKIAFEELSQDNGDFDCMNL